MGAFTDNLPASLAGPITGKTVAMLMDGLLAELGKRDQRIAALEARATAAEATGLKYRGTWQRAQAQDYKRGDVTTHDGSAWVCVADASRDEPRTGNGWQLMVKSGRDAR